MQVVKCDIASVDLGGFVVLLEQVRFSALEAPTHQEGDVFRSGLEKPPCI